MTKRKSLKGDDSTALIYGIVGFLVVSIVVGIVGFFYYAYTRPQSVPGMWLIEHRPSVVFRNARMMRSDKESDDQLL